MGLDSAAAARQAARSILAEGRFHASTVPDPLHGFLVWVGRVVDDPLTGLGHLFDRIGSVFPGGVTGVWAAAAVLVIVGVGGVALRRARTRLATADAASAAARPRPAELERAAEQAERDGRWEDALRLRFRAGLLTLDQLDEFRHTDAIPNHSLARRLGSASFAQAARRFDEVVYGGDAATPGDVEAQRRAWRELAAERRR